MKPDRRTALGLLAGAAALPGRAFAAPVPALPCPDDAGIDAATAPLLALLPEALLRAGLPGADPARLDDHSPDGDAALALAAASALSRLPTGCGGAARVLLERHAGSTRVRYGRNDPLAAIHRPYRVTAYAGPHLDVPQALALWQPLGTPAATEAWLAKLDAFGGALLDTARALRADEAAGCVPPLATARAALAQMDGFALVPAGDHPLIAVLRARGGDQATIDRATALLDRRVQPAMASLRDTLAQIVRKRHAEPGLWSLPAGEALYAANLARAGDTALSPADALALARDEAKRVAALLDRRLAARGYRTGTIAERLDAAFTGHPGLIAADDEAGRTALAEAARSRLDAAHALLPKLVPPALATAAPPRVAPLPDLGRHGPAGSLYIAAGPERDATLWLDVRSVNALPVPGVSPLAYHLGLPGEHLLAEAARTTPRPAIVRAARWPAFTQGWACYAERLAAEDGLFARDPWGDIARLSDELLRAARLAVDAGLHAERWTRVQAEQAMIEMTGAAQGVAIDRIAAMPGEAASYTLGLTQVLALHTAAGRRADRKAFHAALLTGGPRPFASVAE